MWREALLSSPTWTTVRAAHLSGAGTDWQCFLGDGPQGEDLRIVHGAGSSSRGSGEQPPDGDLEQENRGQWARVEHCLLTYHWMRDSDWKQGCLFIVITAVELLCDHTVSTRWWGPVKNWIQKTNSKQCQRNQGGLCTSLQIQSLWFYKIRTMKKNPKGKSEKNLFNVCIRHQFDYAPLHSLSDLCRPFQDCLTLAPELYILPQWKQIEA